MSKAGRWSRVTACVNYILQRPKESQDKKLEEQIFVFQYFFDRPAGGERKALRNERVVICTPIFRMLNFWVTNPRMLNPALCIFSAFLGPGTLPNQLGVKKSSGLPPRELLSSSGTQFHAQTNCSLCYLFFHMTPATASWKSRSFEIAETSEKVREASFQGPYGQQIWISGPSWFPLGLC